MKEQEEPKKASSSRPTEQRQQLDTAVLRHSRGFAALEGEWDELYDSCPSATPFQSWAWLYSWWEVYGEGRYGLRLITLKNGDGLLVGLLPLMVERGPGLRRLLLVGGHIGRSYYSDVMTPYKDVLVRDGWEERVAQAGVEALKGLSGWRVADLRELRPEAASWEIFRMWDGPRTSVPITDYVLIRANSWEELLASLSARARKSARRTLRRAKEDGLRCEPVRPEDAQQAARRLVALHRELWWGRRIAPEHLTPRYEAFIEAASKRMTARGVGRISELRRDGTVVVSQFVVFDKEFVGVHLIGASQEASRRYQFDTLSNWDATSIAYSRGSPNVSFMDGTSTHKLRWASEVVTSQRVLLGRRRVFWIPYFSYHGLRTRYYALRSEAESYVHSESAPRWIKNTTEQYYALQRHIQSEGSPQWIKNATARYDALRRKYGYGWLRYQYELAWIRWEMRKTNMSRTD
jgi:CelD/BcsL family acetyltransferase involved in cellulose biosynthesis